MAEAHGRLWVKEGSWSRCWLDLLTPGPKLGGLCAAAECVEELGIVLADLSHIRSNPPPGAAAKSVDMGDQGGIGIGRMEIDEDKVDDAVLALLRLTLHDGQRAWKGFDWDTLDRLHRKGLIGDPVNKAKSVVLTDEGLRRTVPSAAVAQLTQASLWAWSRLARSVLLAAPSV